MIIRPIEHLISTTRSRPSSTMDMHRYCRKQEVRYHWTNLSDLGHGHEVGSTGAGGIILIDRIKKLFSSLNCSSSSSLSARNPGRNFSSLSRLFIKIFWTAIDFFGFATNTYRELAKPRYCGHAPYLKDMKAFVLHHSPVVLEQVHTKL
jgi:hypothetical protein